MTSSLVTAGVVRVAGVVALATPTLGRGAVTALVAVVGLLVGSFLNVVVYRVPRHLSVVQPRSFCPHCDTPLRSLDNIPLVSWVVLGGRCRKCRAPISIRYPLVELATGIVFAAVGWGLGPHWAVAGFCVLGATFVALVTVERDGLAPPLPVAVVGTSLATAALVAAGVADRRWSHVLGVLVGVGAGTVIVAALARERGGLRHRFSWLAASPVLLPTGAALGWLGPASVAEGLATAGFVWLVARIIPAVRTSGRSGPAPAVVGLALAVGVTVATVVAVAVGTGTGT